MFVKLETSEWIEVGVKIDINEFCVCVCVRLQTNELIAVWVCVCEAWDKWMNLCLHVFWDMNEQGLCATEYK